MSDDPTLVDPLAYKAGDQPDVIKTGPASALSRFPAPHRWATRGVFRESPWAQVTRALHQPELWPGGGSVETAAQRLPAWTFARYRDDTRVVNRDIELSARETRARVLSVHGIMIEYVDEPSVDATHIQLWWGAHAYLAYTTGFHEQEIGERAPGPRWRIMLPFSCPVDLATAITLAAWARHPRHDAGIIAPVTEEAWRVVPVPAVGPGGYRWHAGNGPALDPDVAQRELRQWEALDTRVRAEAALEGTSLADAVDRLTLRRRTPSLRPSFPLPRIPALRELLGSLWPGRVVALLGGGGSGKTTLALQIAGTAALSGLPVLVVLTRMGSDEVVARLLAPRLGIPPHELLAGGGLGEEVDTASQVLRASAPSLHLWAPVAEDRHLDTLRAKIRAVSDAHDGAPPLVVVDGLEGWGVTDPEEGARELVSGLRDASHAGTLVPGWPGAAVVMVGRLPSAPSSPDALIDQAQTGRLDLGGLEHEAGAVIALSTLGDKAVAVVAKNRDGATGAVRLRYDAQRSVFREV